MKLVLTQEEEGEGGRELVALPGVQESAAGADERTEENHQPKRTSRGERTEEGELQECSMKPAEKREVGVVVVVVVVEVEKKKKKKKHNKKRKQNCARGESFFRCPPFSLYNPYNCNYYNNYYNF